MAYHTMTEIEANKLLETRARQFGFRVQWMDLGTVRLIHEHDSQWLNSRSEAFRFLQGFEMAVEYLAIEENRRALAR